MVPMHQYSDDITAPTASASPPDTATDRASCGAAAPQPASSAGRPQTTPGPRRPGQRLRGRQPARALPSRHDGPIDSPLDWGPLQRRLAKPHSEHSATAPRRVQRSTSRWLARSAVSRLRLRVADLFCGGGGSSLGFHDAGYTVALGIDLNANALHCFAKNHPEARALDISVADTAACAHAILLADIDVATVSAPCQGFSPAGHQRANDQRNSLTVSAAKVFHRTRTPIVVFENVPQVESSAAWKSAVAILRDAGYSIQSATLDACNFGCAQRRVRFFAVAMQPGYEFDFEGMAAAAASRARTRVRDVFPSRSHFYHFGRGRKDKCIYSADHESPPLRCNCDYFPKRGYATKPNDDAGIDSCVPFSTRELATLQGWPSSAWLPAKRRVAARVIGNSVAPPVAACVASAAASAFAKKRAVARMCGAIKTADDLRRFQHAAAHGWGHGAVQRAIEVQDAAVDGAYTGTLPGTLNSQWLAMHHRVPDVDASYGAMHMAQIQRRERRRLTQLLRNHIRSDGTLRDLRDPIWHAPPVGAPPSSGNPAAHWANKPWRLPDTSKEPTHNSTVSRCWRNFQVAHMSHCERCQRFSEAATGTPPPLDALRQTHLTGVIPDASTWQLDPDCYQREMVEEIRVGLSPPIDPGLAPVEIPNGKTCWDEWDEAVAYMEKMDEIYAFCDGRWKLPKGAVCSALHMVKRASDVRAFDRDGTPCPVRSVMDLTKSGVNAAVPEWRFRMPNVDDAVALLTKYPHARMGTTDLSKCFPSIGLGASASKACWIRDPRADPTWRGTGPPSAAWLKWQAARRADGKRYPPYRRCSGVPLGLKVAPAFACGLAGEMVQFLTSIGLSASMYVDDLICAAETDEQCAADMATAVSVFSWLGFRCNPDKQEGPSTRITYLGLVIDTEARTVSIGEDRRKDLLRDVSRLLQRGCIGTKDLETLIGKLGFAASVVRGGKAFLHRLRGSLSAAEESSSSTATLDPGARKDAAWWQGQLATAVQGSRIFLCDSPLPVVTLKSDAAGEIGWGYIVDGTLHWSRWSHETVTQKHIQYKELVALVHCMLEYGERFSNRIVRFGVDNSSVCYAANKLSSRCPTLMSLLRQLANAQCQHNCDAVAVHVSRQFNELADLATRFDSLQEFKKFLPATVECPSEGQTQLCRTASPADSAPVWRIKLRSRGQLASQSGRTSSTRAASACSSTSATPTAACGAASSTSRSPFSSSGTSPASTTTSCAPTPRSRSTRPPSSTTRSSTGSTTRAPALDGASPSSSKGSPTASPTSSFSSTRSCSRRLSASAPPWASLRTARSSAAARPTSSSGLGSSRRTTQRCAPSSTQGACRSRTSPSPTAAPSSRSGVVKRSASSTIRRAPCLCRTTTTTRVPATRYASSSVACMGEACQATTASSRKC